MATLGNLTVRFMGDYRNLTRALDRVNNGLDRTGRKMDATAAKSTKMGKAMTVLSRNKGLILLAAGAGAVKATSDFASFDDQMRTVGARSQATASDLMKLTKIAEDLGATTSHTAVEIAEMMGIHAQAGFAPGQIAELIEPTANLKRATGGTSERAADMIAATLRTFSLPVSEATRIADTFTAAVNNSQASLEELSEGMKFVGQTFNNLNISFEDTVGMMRVLHNAQTRGERSGTTMRAVFTKLAGDTKRLEKIFRVTLFRDDGHFVGPLEALRKINDQVKELSGAEKVRLFSDAFDLRSQEAAAVLVRDLGDAVKSVDDIGGSGSAAQVAERMDAGIGGTLRRAWSAVQAFLINAGRLISSIFSPFIKFFTAILGIINRALRLLSVMVQKFVGMIEGLGGKFADIFKMGLQSEFPSIFGDGKGGDGAIDKFFKTAYGWLGMKEEFDVKGNEDWIKDRFNGLFGDLEEEEKKRETEVKKATREPGIAGGNAMLRGSLAAWQAQFSRATPQMELMQKQLQEDMKANKHLLDMPKNIAEANRQMLEDAEIGLN